MSIENRLRGKGICKDLGRRVCRQLFELNWKLRGEARRATLERNLVELNDALAKLPFARRYWLWGGVLLGWAREGRVLAHDTDADFTFFREDLDAFLAAVPTLEAAGFEWNRAFVSSAGQVTEYVFYKDHMKFEFFVVEHDGDGLLYWLYYPPDKLEMIGRLLWTGTEEFDFLGRRWRKPCDHEAQLTEMYGEWRIPDPGYDYTTDEKSIVERRPWTGELIWALPTNSAAQVPAMVNPEDAAPPGWKPCTRETERCEYWTWQRDYLRPSCCTTHLRAVTAFTGRLLARHGIFHFLDYGSLLGAVRSGALIPWDDDADFGCLAADLPRVLALQNEMEQAGFHLDTASAPHLLRIATSRMNGIHADLWFHTVAAGVVTCNYGESAQRWSFPEHFLQKLCDVNLEGTVYPAPSPVTRFLAEHRYGPDFMTPRRLPGDVGWIGREAMTPAVQQALDELRERDFRMAQLQKQARQAPARRGPGIGTRLYAITRNLPAWVLRMRRALWLTRARLLRQYPQSTPTLLEIRYEMHRRDTVIRMLEGR